MKHCFENKGGTILKKGLSFLIVLTIALAITSFLLFAYAKNQNEEVRYYKTAFYMGTQDLIENYSFILDLEKRYLTEKNMDKKKQMMEELSNFIYLLENHSSSVSSLLYKQVDVDEFVVLESNIRMAFISLQNASSDNEREIHIQKLDAALAKFVKFIDENMKMDDICISDSCEK